MVLRVLRVLHVVIAHEVVALQARALRRIGAAEHPVGEHGLADVYAAVVDEIHLADGAARRGENTGKAFADGVVAEVPEVQGLVRVRAGELQHHPAPVQRRAAPVRGALRGYFREDVGDHRGRGKAHVHVGAFRRGRTCFRRAGDTGHALCHLGGDHRGALAEDLCEREHGKRNVPHLGTRRRLHHEQAGVDPCRPRLRGVFFERLGDDPAPLVLVFLHSVTGI